MKSSTIIEAEYVIEDIVAPSFRDKMEDLGELQWVRTVVDHKQAGHAYYERRQAWGRRLCVARCHFMLHFLEG